MHHSHLCRKLDANVRTFDGRDFLRLFLSGVPDEPDRAVVRYVQARFTLKGKEDYSMECEFQTVTPAN